MLLVSTTLLKPIRWPILLQLLPFSYDDVYLLLLFVLLLLPWLAAVLEEENYYYYYY